MHVALACKDSRSPLCLDAFAFARLSLTDLFSLHLCSGHSPLYLSPSLSGHCLSLARLSSLAPSRFHAVTFAYLLPFLHFFHL